MVITMTDDEIELKLRDFFEENFQYLKESSGHTIDAYMKEKAFQQVLYYWKKNRALIERITRSEVKLSLPEQKTPNDKIPYTLEGVVDIVQEIDGIWLYDLKTHDKERIQGNLTPYKEQLFMYAFIWKNLQGNELDNTAIISTPLPFKLQRAIELAKPELIEREVKNWQPVIPIGYSEDEVADMIDNFGEVVEHIENSRFSAPDVDSLLNIPDGMKKPFAVHVCRNCDVRFSCRSYVEYMKVNKGANRNNMFKYMCVRAEDQDDFITGNLSEE
ncbi:MAG TPA: PD-(D/E)XK nuclease family protein [Treponemataceae bacterium]|nr:PD-(D/E)XK nuclease family protein [Treponemataceae bacterium]